MNQKDIETYDFFISKTMFNLIALFGFLLIFLTGVFWGYTFKENEQNFNTEVKEIKFVKYIHSKYIYNFIPNPEVQYGDEISKRISIVTLTLIFIGTLLLEIGYRGSCKYKYNKSLKQRIKYFIEKTKIDDKK
jgi:hypothetical protein